MAARFRLGLRLIILRELKNWYLVGSVINDRPMSHPLMQFVGVPGVGQTISPFLIDSRALPKIPNARDTRSFRIIT